MSVAGPDPSAWAIVVSSTGAAHTAPAPTTAFLMSSRRLVLDDAVSRPSVSTDRSLALVVVAEAHDRSEDAIVER
jgi:hypothetical protein